jgi:hypothetical protein
VDEIPALVNSAALQAQRRVIDGAGDPGDALMRVPDVFDWLIMVADFEVTGDVEGAGPGGGAVGTVFKERLSDHPAIHMIVGVIGPELVVLDPDQAIAEVPFTEECAELSQIAVGVVTGDFAGRGFGQGVGAGVMVGTTEAAPGTGSTAISHVAEVDHGAAVCALVDV